jgi:hypothetical protein
MKGVDAVITGQTGSRVREIQSPYKIEPKIADFRYKKR